MDPNEEIEDLELDPDATEEFLDEGIEEPLEDYSEPIQGRVGYKGNKYHADRINELNEKSEKLKEKVEGLKEEKEKKWKLKDPKDDGPVKADGSNTRLKTKSEKLGDNARLAHAKAQEKINKVQRMKANLDRATDMVAHPLDAAKEAAKDKTKDVAKKTGKIAAKAAVKTAGKVAKVAGRLIATGGKAIISFLASNPIALAIIGVAAILFVIFGLLFSHTSDEDLESEGYFDTTCDFNLTSVEFNVCGSSTVKTIGLKEYVLSVAYGESQEEDFSEAALKALMIIVKTNVLANGNYDSSSNKVIKADDCNVLYENVNEELPDEEENKKKQDKVKLLKEYYNEIESFLYISESFRQELTELDSESTLKYDDDVIEQLAETDENDYEKILDSIYGDENGSSDNETIISSKPTIFVGDSRTIGMDNAVKELSSDDVVAKEGKGYSWFVSGETDTDSAINLVTKKVEDKSHNIVIWLGVNDLQMEDDYFNKYKELAEGAWSKHTIYIVSVGPLNTGEDSEGNDNNDAVEDFNDKMHKNIVNSNISNLKYIDLGLTKENMDWDGCNDGIHYGNAAYQKIYDKIVSHYTKNLSKTKALFNNSEYCSYYRYRKNGCEIGWWWPIGSANPTSGNIYGGDPVRLGTSYTYGWRCLGGVCRNHNGEDIHGARYDPIIATRSGVVAEIHDGQGDGCLACLSAGWGNYIVIDHGDGFKTRYAHMTKNSFTVKVGDHVVQGQKIGEVGNSGRTSGPHLHFEITLNGSYVNPLDYVDLNNPRPAGKCYSADKSGVCKALKDLGFSDNAVAGLMTNIKAETWYFDFDPNAYVANDNGGPSMGIIMWHDVFACANYDVCSAKNSGYTCNASALKCFCEENNLEWNSVECQTQYLKKYIDDHANVYDFDAATTIYDPNASAYDVANQFCIKLERPANKYSNCPKRASNYASDMLNFVKNVCKD